MKRRIALFFIAKKLIAPFFLIRLMHFKEEIFASSLISYKLRSSLLFPLHLIYVRAVVMWQLLQIGGVWLIYFVLKITVFIIKF